MVFRISLGVTSCIPLPVRHLFMIELQVQGFFYIDFEGRKSYTKGKTLKWVVEFQSFSIDLLMKSLCTAVEWDSSQTATVWFFDKRIGEDIKLVDDTQLVDVFEMYSAEMYV